MITPSEIRHAALVGVARDLTAQKQKRTPVGAGSPTFYGHICGALGELVVAKSLGVYWEPNVGGCDHDGDVENFHVRSNMPTSRSLLWIRDSDADDAALVLVTGMPPALTIRGWIPAEEARQLGRREQNGGYPPAYCVEPELLHPWDERPY